MRHKKLLIRVILFDGQACSYIRKVIIIDSAAANNAHGIRRIITIRCNSIDKPDSTPTDDRNVTDTRLYDVRNGPLKSYGPWTVSVR